MKKLFTLLLVTLTSLFMLGCEEMPEENKREGTIVLRYALEDNSYTPFTEAMRYFAREVEKVSHGKIRIEQKRYATFSVNSDLVLDTVMNTLDLALVPVNRISQLAPGPSLLGAPYLMQASTFDDLMEPGGKLIKKVVQDLSSEKTHLVGVDIWYGGYIQILMRDRQILSPSDMAGQRFWVRGPGPDMDYLLAMNAIPYEMSFSSGVYAAKHGYLDGIMLPISMIISNKLDKYMHYLTLTNHARMNYILLMSLETWKQLSAEEHNIISECASKTGFFVRDLTRELEDIDLSRMRHQGVVKIIEPDPEQFIKKSEYVRTLYLKKNPVQSLFLRQLIREQNGSSNENVSY